MLADIGQEPVAEGVRGLAGRAVAGQQHEEAPLRIQEALDRSYQRTAGDQIAEQMLPAQGHAIPVQGRLYDHRVVVEPQAVALGQCPDAIALQPGLPGDGRPADAFPDYVVQMQQGMLQQVLGLSEPRMGVQIGRAADREGLLGEQDSPAARVKLSWRAAASKVVRLVSEGSLRRSLCIT